MGHGLNGDSKISSFIQEGFVKLFTTNSTISYRANWNPPPPPPSGNVLLRMPTKGVLSVQSPRMKFVQLSSPSNRIELRVLMAFTQVSFNVFGYW